MATLKSIKNKYLTVSDGTVLGVTTNTENITVLSFKLATADSLSKFNLVDGFSDDYNDATGVDASGSTDEIRNSSNYYSGSQTGAVLNAYTSGSGNWTCPAGVTSVEVLVVAGGGGGAGYGGGGGAGGVVHHTGKTVVPSTTYAYTVGTGGAGTNYNQGTAGDGINSTFDSMDAEGGGGSSGSSSAGRDGGSGGGGNGGYSSAGGSSDQPASSGGGTGYGNPGGAGVGGAYMGGGGGGASAAGTAGTQSPAVGGPGGAGKFFAGFEAYGTDSSNVASSGSNGGYFGGGGGGSSHSTPTVGLGGVGGGALGRKDDQGYNGLANTGGGGGGVRNAQGGTGGTGIVLIKEVDAYNDMTLQSTGYTAQADPTTARILLDEEAYTGDTTLNTDIKAYASRDGTTFTQVVLADQGQLNYLAGIDTYTKLMLHMDGSNDGTTFTDSSGTGHTMTASGDVHTDTAIKKLGTASAQFDGTTDYITSAASTEFSFTADFTIDCWCYFSAINTTIAGSLSNWDWNSATTNDWILLVDGSGYITFNVKGVGSVATTATHGGLSAWKHIAVERASGTSKIYVDGTLASSASTAPGSGTISANNIVTLGRAATNLTGAYNGYIDEFRISKGIARYGANFNPPTTAYTQSRRLLSGSVDISGQPAGSNMKYKLTTHNQAITKQTRVYGTSMAWA